MKIILRRSGPEELGVKGVQLYQYYVQTNFESAPPGLYIITLNICLHILSKLNKSIMTLTLTFARTYFKTYVRHVSFFKSKIDQNRNSN